MQKKQKIIIISAVISVVLALVFITLATVSSGNRNKRGEFAVPVADNIYKIVWDGDVYVESDAEGNVYCYDATNPDEPLWQYDKRDTAEGAIAPSVNCLSVAGNSVLVGYGDRYILSFDKTSGNVLNCYYIGYEPKKIVFDEDGNNFVVAGETNGIKAVYMFSADGKGHTFDEPERADKAFSLNKNSGLETGYSDLMFSDDCLYVATEVSTINRIPYTSSGFLKDDAVEFFASDANIVAIGKEDDGMFALDENGVYYRLDEEGDVAGKNRLKADVVTAVSSGNFILAKTKNGGLMGIKEGKLSFKTSVGTGAIIVFVNEDSFGYVEKTGGELKYYKVSDASVSGQTFAVFVAYTVMACVFAVCSVFLWLSAFGKTAGGLKRFALKAVKTLKQGWFCYVALIPTFVLLIIFYYYPIIWGMCLSFFDYIPGEKSQFVGMANIVAVLKNTQFWSSTSNMFILLITDLLKALIPPFIFAECILAVNSKKFSFWARVLLFIPGILPGVAGTLVWAEGIFGSGSSGLLNGFLTAVDGNFVAKAWLMNERTALNCLIWFGFPWIGSYLIIYGAISAVPSSMYEAAKLDGCGWARKIVCLDLPMIVPQIKYIFITSFIASIQDYGRIYVTTKGDFNTATPALLMYLSITKDKNYGVAGAMSLFLFAFLIIVTAINFKMQNKNEA